MGQTWFYNVIKWGRGQVGKAAPLTRLVGAVRMLGASRKMDGHGLSFSGIDQPAGLSPIARRIAAAQSHACNLEDRPGAMGSVLDRTGSEASAKEAIHRRARFAFLGNLERRNGLDVLLVALAILKSKRLEFHFAIGGEGSLRGDLERISGGLRLAESVVFVGRVADRSRFFEDRSVLVLPMRFDGFPISLLEAAAHGQCVVASDVSGVSGIIDHGRTGFVVPKEDPVALAEALEELIGDDGLRSRMAAGLARSLKFQFAPPDSRECGLNMRA